jgi:hypothetical protein
MRRGSATMIWAPCRSRRFIREAKTGWASVGLAPMTRITSACSTEAKSWVPAEVPKVWLQAVAGGGVADPGAGVDVVVAEGGPDHLLDDVDLLVGAPRGRDAADRADAVLGLDRAEAVGPCGRWPRPRRRRARGRRSTRAPSGAADGRGGVAEGEAALDARVALVGAAGLDGIIRTTVGGARVALHLGLERAADPAVGAGRLDRPGRHRRAAMTDFSVSASVGQACTQAPHETHSESRKLVPPGAIRESKPRPSTVSAKVPWTSSHAARSASRRCRLAGRSRSRGWSRRSRRRGGWLAVEP